MSLDVEQFFDRVNHDVLLSRVRARVTDRRVVALIHRFLKAGVFTLEGVREPTVEGTPQGGPLSPLLANLLLDEFDKELKGEGTASSVTLMMATSTSVVGGRQSV